jgi:4-amino-4-deoxy-L-arabinose transferase-like glycosyltransferase
LEREVSYAGAQIRKRGPAAWGFDWTFPLGWGGAYAILGLVLHLLWFPIGDLDTETDFYGDLVLAAQKLVHGEFAVQNYPYKGPVYSSVLAFVHAFVRDWYHSAAVVSALSAAACLVVLYRFVLRLFDRTTAVASVVAFSTIGEFFMDSHRGVTDLLFLALALASASLVCRSDTTRRSAVLAGVCAGLAFLTRYNGAVLPLATLAAVLWVNPHETSRRDRWRWMAMYGCGLAAMTVPWFITSVVQTGHLLYTKNLQNLVYGIYDDPRWTGDPSVEFDSLRGLVGRDPGYFLRQSAGNLLEHFRADLSMLLGFPWAVVAVLGIIGAIRWRPTRPQWGLYVFHMTYGLALAPVFYAPRFFLFLCAGYLIAGLGALARAARQAAFVRWSIAIAFLVAAGWQANQCAKTEVQFYNRRVVHLLEAANALRQHAAGADKVVMARKGHVALHAGLRYQPFPRDVPSLVSLLEFMRDHKADYVVYSQAEYALVPALQFMTALDSIPGLHQVYRSRQVRVFERQPGAPIPVLTPQEHLAMLAANVKVSEAGKIPQNTYRAQSELGRYLTEQGDLPNGEHMLRAAATTAEANATDAAGRHDAATARHNVAAVLAMEMHFTAAQAMLEQNLEYFGREGNPNDLAMTHELMGAIYDELGQAPNAASHYAAALAMFQKSHNTAGEAFVRQKMAGHAAPPPGPAVVR